MTWGVGSGFFLRASPQRIGSMAAMTANTEAATKKTVTHPLVRSVAPVAAASETNTRPRGGQTRPQWKSRSLILRH
jgi:hypothetical protein